MPTALETRLRDKLARYLARELSLQEFTETFIPMLWVAAEEDDPVAADLAAQIDLLLIEHDQGDRTEEDLRRLLSPLAARRSSPYGSSARTDVTR